MKFDFKLISKPFDWLAGGRGDKLTLEFPFGVWEGYATSWKSRLGAHTGNAMNNKEHVGSVGNAQDRKHGRYWESGGCGEE